MDRSKSFKAPPLQEDRNWGSGLFVSDEAQASSDVAYSKIHMLLSTEGRAASFDDDQLRRDLLETCRSYWADHEFDARKSLVAIRDEVSRLHYGIRTLLPSLSRLSQETTTRIEFVLNPSKARSRVSIAALRSDLQRLEGVCSTIVEYEGKKKGTGRTSITNCCSRLIELRSQLTGKPFAKTWTGKPGAGAAVEAFTGHDAQFVLEVMKAIDPRVTFSNVRSAGMSLTSKASKKK